MFASPKSRISDVFAPSTLAVSMLRAGAVNMGAAQAQRYLCEGSIDVKRRRLQISSSLHIV
jgi:hypothetical protein